MDNLVKIGQNTMGNSQQRPIRILHIVGGMNRGGVETWLMQVLRTIDRDQFQMDFLVHTLKPCPYDQEVRALGSQILPCPRPDRPWSYAHRFKQLLDQHGPYDIVHSHVHHYSGFILKLADQIGVPVRIAHSHNDTSVLQARAGLVRRCYLVLMGLWIKHYATVKLACSMPAARALFGPRWKQDAQCQILYYGVDLSSFQDTGVKVSRQQMGIDAGAFVVGHVGRFSKQKNHHFLITIAQEIILREPNTIFLLIGDGELRSAIQQQVIQAGLEKVFVLTGERPDVAQLMMNAIDVFVLPSFHEGLPLVAIEAQAAGLPCILSSQITSEINIMKQPFVQQLALSQPASVWAEAILQTRVLKVSRPVMAKHIENSHFNIKHSIERLKTTYESALSTIHKQAE